MHIADGYPADKLGVGGGGGVFFIGWNAMDILEKTDERVFI